MNKSLLTITLSLIGLMGVAHVAAPEAGVPYQIITPDGDVLSWQSNSLRVLADGDSDHQVVYITNTDSCYYTLQFEGVEGYLGAEQPNGWMAQMKAECDSALCWFEFIESEQFPGYVNIKCKGMLRGSGMLGYDKNDPTVYTDKADGSRSVWEIIPYTNDPLVVTSLEVEPAEATINVGATVALQANATVESGKPKYTWTSTNPMVATVSSKGVVTGNADGTATIEVECGGLTAYCNVTVIGVDNYPDLPDGDVRKDAYEGYKLVFAEEFSVDGDPDYSVWNLEDGYKRNNEDQYYINPNSNMGKALGVKAAYIEDGVLVIEARHDDLPNPFYGTGNQKETIPYTSASLQTKGNANGGYSWLFGIYEVRAKITAERGLWPAIWSTGEQYEWPYGGEIDIMEYYNDRLHANVCWGGKTRWQGVWNSKTLKMSSLPENWDQDFHIWRMIWDYDHMVLMVDDIVINDIDLNTTVNANPGQSWYNKDGVNPFRDVRQMGWVNLALGGNNGGSLANTTFPSYYLIDYFRVYQKIGSDGKATYHVDEEVSEPTWGDFGAVKAVEADQADAPVEIYDLCGRKVSNVDGIHGVYIVKQGSKATKMAF